MRENRSKLPLLGLIRLWLDLNQIRQQGLEGAATDCGPRVLTGRDFDLGRKERPPPQGCSSPMPRASHVRGSSKQRLRFVDSAGKFVDQGSVGSRSRQVQPAIPQDRVAVVGPAGAQHR